MTGVKSIRTKSSHDVAWALLSAAVPVGVSMIEILVQNSESIVRRSREEKYVRKTVFHEYEGSLAVVLG